jgi:hypothetical protein
MLELDPGIHVFLAFRHGFAALRYFMRPQVVYDYDPRNLSHEILAAIGLVVACSAQTESVVEMGIGGCLGIEVDYSYAVTTHMNAPLRDNVLRAVAEIRIDDLDDLDELDRLLDEVKVAFTKRNEYVHRTWCVHPESGHCFISKIEARGSVDAELIPVTLRKIREDATYIYDAGMNLMRFLSARNLLSPFPKHRRERAHKTKAARKKRREAKT